MRVLLAQGDPISRRLLEATLRKAGFEVHTTDNGENALQLLQKDEVPWLAILDRTLPGLDGMEVCRAIRRGNTRSYPYLLLLHSQEAAATEVQESLDSGADDYLIQPVDANELRARLKVGGRVMELQAQCLSLCDEFRARASQDSLTGLWNHGAILEILDQELARACRERRSVGVIMADLDHFKRINDTYGHLAGDAVLRETTRAFRSVLRPYDAIGRYGGEEFLMVLPGCDAASSARLGERLRESVARTSVTYGRSLIMVTASLGAVSSTCLEENVSGTAILHAADAALYRAKHAGRNRVECERLSPILPLNNQNPHAVNNLTRAV